MHSRVRRAGRWLRGDRDDHDRRIAESTRRLLVDGFRARTPLDAAAVVAHVLAGHVGASRAVVLLFADRDCPQLRFAAVGLTPEMERAVQASIDELGADRSRSPGWRRSHANAAAVEVVDDEAGCVVRPGGVLDRLGAGAHLGIPLIGPDGTVGTVLCTVDTPRRWTAETVADAGRLGMAAAAVIEGARRGEAERRARELLEHRATHDSLTGLANRASLLEALERRLQDLADDGGASVTVLVVDLDRFKQVNDTLGHGAGDRLLELASARLRAQVRPDDTVGRFGGDEFAVIMSAPRSGTQPIEAVDRVAAEVAGRVAAALRVPYELDASVVEVAASVGVATARRRCTAAELLAAADAAMYRAKRTGSAFAVSPADGGAPTR